VSLTRERIIQKELEYFKSDLAVKPAYIIAEYDEYVDSYDEDRCVYKTDDGRKCAVGALIKPALYDPEIDSDSGTPVKMLPDRIIDYLGEENLTWLTKLQQCHDDLAREWNNQNISATHFGRHFLSVAKTKGLLS
jgi:hypothetical protein